MKKPRAQLCVEELEPRQVPSTALAYSSNWSKPFTTTFHASAQRPSAERVVEAPSSKSVLPLGNFGSAAFTNANATINKSSGAVDAASGTQVDPIAMVSQHGSLEDQTSALNAAGTALAVTVAASAAGGSSGPGGRATSGRGARIDNNQTVSLTAVPPPATVSPELVFVQQFPAPSVATTQINFPVATPSSQATIVQAGFLASGYSAAAALGDNAPAHGAAAPDAARQAPDVIPPGGIPPVGIPPTGMPPAGMPANDVDPPQAHPVESAAAVTVLQQADAVQALVQDLGISIDLANTGAASVAVAGVGLVLACSSWCGVGISDPSERARECSKLRKR